MIGHNYSYFYAPPPPPPVQPPPPTNNHNNTYTASWNNWATKPPQYVQDFSRPPPPIHGNAVNYNGHALARTSHGYSTSQNNLRHYPPRTRYNSANQYGSPSQQPWQRHQNSYKKPRLDTDVYEPKTKPLKKKKPLSQNIPAKRGWTLDDAQRALTIEKDYSRRFKNHSLIIKFPDFELNKEIVSKLHPAIENVHFQQPSTARFCFVTLQPTEDAEAVIAALNKQKFGDGYLCAEHKKDRDEDQVLQPTDIDPRTLYVGNLAQEVTKDDMMRAYPKSRRIDIGYAKKMKYTRYAFVGFKDIDDSIDAFIKTHSTEMHSKSLIVRFRRINGTVGMPGESKPQNPPKTNSETLEELTAASTPNDTSKDSIQSSDTDVSVNVPTEQDSGVPRIKIEPTSNDEVEMKPVVPEYTSVFAQGNIEEAWAKIKPIIKTEVKTEVKSEFKTEIKVENGDTEETTVNEDVKECPIKTEPACEEDDELYDGDYEECYFRNESDNEGTVEDDSDVFSGRASDFDSVYESMVSRRANIMSSLKNIHQH